MKIRISFKVDFHQELENLDHWLEADDDSKKIFIKDKILEHMEFNIDDIVDNTGVMSRIKLSRF